MDKITATRRAVLGALAVAPVAIAQPMPLSAKPSAFAAAIARYRAAKAVEDKFDDGIYAAAITAHERAAEAFDVAWPDKLFVVGSRHVSTSDWRTAQGIRRDMTNVRYMERCCWDDHRNDMAFLDAHDARAAALLALPERKQMDAATDRSDHLCDLRCEARDAVITCPIASLAELAAKFDFIVETDQWDDDTVQAALRADIARLAAGGLN